MCDAHPAEGIGKRASNSRVAIIGAGWAGLSAAVHLVRHGVRPVLIDAAPQAGGRARGIDLELAGRSCRLDNGQHLLVGAYQQTLALIDQVGGSSAIVRQPMRLEAVDGLLIRPVSAPAPLDLLGGLLTAQGLSWAERWALLRCLAGQRLNGWRVPPGLTVAEWLLRNRQPLSLISRFWEPLCVATLNTPPASACARTFVTVLQQTLGRDAVACEFVLPRLTLDEVLPQPALRWLAQHQVPVTLRQAVRSLHPLSVQDDALPASVDSVGQVSIEGVSRQPVAGRTPLAGFRLDTTGGSHQADQVILAVPPINALRMLEAGGFNDSAAHPIGLGEFDYEPIATVYLAWRDSDVNLKPWLMLTEDPTREAYGQWLFDRGDQHGLRIGAVVVSARGRAWLAAADTDSALPAQAIAAQVSRQVGLPMPLDARAIVDKRATFRCTPSRPQPVPEALQDRLPGLWLAGDYMWPDFPATLEAAVRSGQRAAEGCLRAIAAGP